MFLSFVNSDNPTTPFKALAENQNYQMKHTEFALRCPVSASSRHRHPHDSILTVGRFASAQIQRGIRQHMIPSSLNYFKWCWENSLGQIFYCLSDVVTRSLGVGTSCIRQVSPKAVDPITGFGLLCMRPLGRLVTYIAKRLGGQFAWEKT